MKIRPLDNDSQKYFGKNLHDIISTLPIGIIIGDKNGESLYANKTALNLLGASTQRRSDVKNIIAHTGRYKSELISDFPYKSRVIRVQTQYIQHGGKEFVAATVEDVTQEWVKERQQEILEYTANILAQVVPLTQWMKTLITKVVVLMKVKSCTIMIYDAKTRVLRTALSSGKLSSNKLALELGEGIAGYSAKELKTMVVPNTLENKRFKRGVHNRDYARSLLAVPMITNNRLIGVLNITDEPNKHFREQDRAFYTVLANRLALAFEHSNLIERLKQERERLSTVIANSGHSMVLTKADGEIMIANEAFADLIQDDIQKVVGKNIISYLPEVEELINSTETESHAEKELNSLQGKPWVGITTVRIESRGAQNIVLTIQDITAEKHLEQLKNDFVATATHELRTPLTAILGYLQLLSGRNEGFDEKQKLYIHRIEQASKNLFNLVEDILSVLKIDQESLTLRPEKHKVLPLIREIVHSLESKITNKSMKISLPKKDYSVYTDINALQRILINLIDNAIKYSHRKTKIIVSFKEVKQRKSRCLRIDIADTGVGIPKREQQNIFEKFHRAPNELSVEAGGTGLGLYISKKLAEQLGGSLELKKSGPQGSTFSLTVPQTKKASCTMSTKISV